MTRTALMSCLDRSDDARPARVGSGSARPVPAGQADRVLYLCQDLVIDLVDADPEIEDAGALPTAALAALGGRCAPYADPGWDGSGAAVAREFYRYTSGSTRPGEFRTLIVARIAAGAEQRVAEIFGKSDAGELPGLIGVTTRCLLRLGTLYLHYIDADQPIAAAVSRHRDHPAFADINDQLSAYIAPYSPATWRSPADAMATEIYRWRPVG